MGDGYPVLVPVRGGWFACGDGWAVEGGTREEALWAYRRADERHRRIMQRPPERAGIDDDAAR